MFEVKIDGIDELLGKLDKFQGQIIELHKTMPAELENWQREDMKRKYPNQQTETTGNQTAATTYVWPRSRTPSKNKRRYQAPRQHQIRRRGPVVRSNRPILRAELLQQLFDRMTKVLSEAMKWP